MPPTVQFILQNKILYQAQLAKCSWLWMLSECGRAIAPPQNKRKKVLIQIEILKKNLQEINHCTFCLSLSSSITSCSSRPLLTHSAFS